MDTSPEMNVTLQEMVAHHEIRKVLNAYCHACDRGDGPRMASVYGQASWDDHGIYRGPGPDFAKFIMDTLAAAEGKVSLSHLLGQSLIKVDGNRAGAETSFLSTTSQRDEKGEEAVTLHGGRYVDTLRREGGEWKIEKRICTRDWSITLDVKKNDLEHYNYVRGELSGQDPSYAVLGLTHPGLR
jgi:hypothetical protein